MKKKIKSISRIVTAALIVSTTPLMTSCFLKDNSDIGVKYNAQEENDSNLTEKDISKFASTLKKIDGDAIAHYKMALYFQEQKKHKLAIEELKKAVGRDPSYAKAYNAMGISFDKLRKYDRAIDCYQHALKIDPDLDYAHNNLGYSYLLSDNLDAAIESLQKAIQLNDRNKRYRNNLALVYVMKDRYDLAIDQLKDLEGGPHAGETVAKLAQQLGKKGFEKQIVSVLERMALENALASEKKLASGRSSIVQEKTNNQETVSASRKPTVISGKIDWPANDNNDSKLANKLATGAPEPKGTKLYENDLVVGKNASDSPLSESKNSDGNKHLLKSWEETCAKIAEQAEKNQVISVISDADQIPVDDVQAKTNATYEIDQHRINDDQKSSDQTIFSAASGLHLQPAIKKPVSIAKGFQGTNLSPPSNKNSQEIAKPPQTKIKSRVVDVAEYFKHSAKDTEHPLSAESSGNIVAVNVSKNGGKTWKISPVYVASASSSESTNSKGLSEIEILPLRLDEKGRLAPGSEQRKTDNPGKYIAEIEIANGSGVEGMAAKIGDLLGENGFKIFKITNANSPDHVSTKIFYYNGQRRAVARIIKKIICCSDERNIIELENLGNRIKIIVGKDLSQPS